VKMTEKAQGLVKELTDLFMDPDTMIEGMATVCLYGSEEDNRPIDRWSLRNRLLAWAAGTFEARTFNQWKTMGVSVLKGSHAFYILGPNLIDEKKNGVKTGEKILIGYRVIPEFKVEDTDFADQMPEWKPKDAPPLSAIADRWGLAVRYVPRNVMADAAGYTDCETRITLCTHDELGIPARMNVRLMKSRRLLKWGRRLSLGCLVNSSQIRLTSMCSTSQKILRSWC